MQDTTTRRRFLGATALAAAGCRGLVAAGSDRTPSAPGSGNGSSLAYSRSLSVDYETDVFVAGGGPAGVVAAVAAAREGKSVFVAETSGSFGGAATAAYVPAFATFSDGVRQIVGGIGGEIRGGVSKEVPSSAYWTPIDLEELKVFYDGMVEKAGVRFSFFTSVCDVVARNGHVEHVVLSSKRGLFAVRAKIYLDCTGDGDLCAFAGGAYELGDEEGSTMPPTLCSQWCDIDFSQKNEHAEKLLPKAIADGVFSVHDYHLPGFFVGPHRGSGLGRGNIGHVFGINPTDERSLTKAMVDARRRMPEYGRFYREYQKGYERARLASTAPFLGVRESRRITCDYTLTVEDFLKRSQFEDQIGRYCYPVDLHISKPGDKAKFDAFLKEYQGSLRYKKGESYGIPYRSLVPKSFDNVLVAGRCIGTDRKMQASIRVMPGCFVTGEAIGRAAALACASRDVRKVKYPDLRDRLLAAGAVL